MMNITLSRSKLVTRDITETMEYTVVNNYLVAIHVNVCVNGSNPFKESVYAITSLKKFDEMLQKIPKDKGDFVYSESAKSIDETYQWFLPTTAEFAKFSVLPTEEDVCHQAYAMRYIEDTQELNIDITKNEQARKLYMNATKKNGRNMVHFTIGDHSLRNSSGQLIPIPHKIQHGLQSEYFHLKPMIEYFRTLPNVFMECCTYSKGVDYPELHDVPSYNAAFSGEQELCVWILPSTAHYNKIRGGKEHRIFDIYTLNALGILDIDQFKK